MRQDLNEKPYDIITLKTSPQIHPAHETKPDKLDPQEPHIKESVEKYPHRSRVRFFKEIQNQGYDGKPTIIGNNPRQRILEKKDIFVFHSVCQCLKNNLSFL